jgi:hypothetical protein
MKKRKGVRSYESSG